MTIPGRRSDSGPRDPRGNRRNRAFSHVPAPGQLRRTGADERRHGGPRRAATLQLGLQPRAALGLHRGRALACKRTKGPHGLRLRQLLRPTVWPGRPKGRKSSAKVAVAHELSKVVYVVWTKRRAVHRYAAAAAGQPCRASVKPKETPTAKTTLRLGPAPSPYGPPPGNRRPDPFVIGPSDAAYPFCAGRVAAVDAKVGRNGCPNT